MKKFSKAYACAASTLVLSAMSPVFAGDFYQQRNLVSNTAALHAEHIDPNVVNAWGIAFNPYGFAWVANNGTGVATRAGPTGACYLLTRQQRNVRAWYRPSPMPSTSPARHCPPLPEAAAQNAKSP